MSFRVGQAKGPSVGSSGGSGSSTDNAGNSTIWTYKGYDNVEFDPNNFVLNAGEFLIWTPNGSPSTNQLIIFNPIGLDGIDYSNAFTEATTTSVISVQDSTDNNLKWANSVATPFLLTSGNYIFSQHSPTTIYDTFTPSAVIDSTSVVGFDYRETPIPPTAGGNITEIQYNDNTTFGGVTNLTYDVNNPSPNGSIPVQARYPFIWHRTVMVDTEISLLDALDWISCDTILIGDYSFVQNNNMTINNGDKNIVILANNLLDLSLSVNFFGVNSLRIYGLVTFNSITGNVINLDSDVYIKELGGLQTTINFTGTGTLYYESFDGGDAPVGWTGNIVKQHWSKIRPAPSSDANNIFAYGTDGLPFVPTNNVRIGTTTSTSSLSIDTDLYDQYNVTALAVSMTINAPTNGSDGKKLIIRIKDSGSAQSLTWDAIFRAIGITLPTTTTANKTIYVGCIYNNADSKWDVIAVAEEV